MQLREILEEFRKGCGCEECTEAAMSAIQRSASLGRDAIALDIFKIVLMDMARNSDEFFSSQSVSRAAAVSFASADAFITARVPVGLGASGAIDHFDGVTEGLREAVTIGEEIVRTTAGMVSHAAVKDYMQRIKDVIDARR